jgi:hypothetical protein
MRPGKRFGLSAIEKRDIWSRWKAGQSLHEIGRAFDQPPPAVVRLNGDLCFLAGLWGVLPVRYFYFNLPQQRHDLLRLVFLHRHVQLSLEWFSLTPAGLIQAGHVTAKANLTEVKKEGPDVTVAASISAELGPQYRLGALTVMPVDSDRALSLKPQALREEFRLQSGEILNAGEIRNGLSSLRKIYLEYGFIYMSAEPQVKIDDAEKTINVVILVDEERQYFVKDVQFLGVDPWLEARLRRKLPRNGWLFNSRVLENFFKENRSVLPADASLEDDVEFHRNAKDATVTLLFDLRPCPGQSN